MGTRNEIFIGNIPYGVTEDEIKDVLRRAGTVVNYRATYDKDTGKPKGYAFAEYAYPEEAESAVRNLDNHEIQGRKIKVNWAQNASKPNQNQNQNQNQHQNQNQNQQPQQYHNIDHHHPQQLDATPQIPFNEAPPGKDLEPGLTAEDAISKIVNTLPPAQLLDILASMQDLAMKDPAKAKVLLDGAPQLSYAIFQSLLLLNLVDGETLRNSIMQATTAAATVPAVPHANPLAAGIAPVPIPAPAQQYIPPPQPQVPQQYPPPYQQQYQQPPPPPVQQQAFVPPPPQPVNHAAADPQTLIQQVMAMTEEQINAMRPDEAAQIRMVRARFAGAA